MSPNEHIEYAPFEVGKHLPDLPGDLGFRIYPGMAGEDA